MQWGKKVWRALLRGHVVCALSAALLMCVATSKAAEPFTAEAVVNAPLERIWTLFTSGEGYALMGAAQADVDLRLGGRIRFHGDAQGKLGDAQGTEWEILAYDPQHLLTSRPVQIPATFPHREGLLGTWNVVYFNAIADTMTHVRIVMLGYGDDTVSQAAATATAQRMRAALDRLVQHFRPACARCEQPK